MEVAEPRYLLNNLLLFYMNIFCTRTYVCTRWNSTYAMIGSVVEQQAAIVAIFHTRRELHYLEPFPTEWHFLEDLHCLLEPFKDSTEILSGQYYPTLSCLGSILKKS